MSSSARLPSDMVHSRRCPNCWSPIALADPRFCPECGVDLQTWRDSDTGRYDRGANVISLDRSPLTVGRGPQCDIQLDHPAVAERHAMFEYRPEAGAWFVVDFGSAAGTYVNYGRVRSDGAGQAIDPARDTIWIAPYAFRFSVDPESASQSLTPAHLRLDGSELVRTVGGGRRTPPLTILDLRDISLSFRPGEFIALVGGSGAGKSTLMKALLGLSPAQKGIVYVGGRPFIVDGQAFSFEAIHAVIGYVPQDDVMHRELTVWEALDYVARLRLAPDLSREERAQCIADTLETVDLLPHREKMIRMLSGGQRKRVNIALELLARPRLLFLDEPTSGLDPGLDLSVMELLRAWATDPEDPRTIILVTHATENITTCKYVVFMSAGGHVAFFGPPREALTYFGVERFAEIYRTIGSYEVGSEDDRDVMRLVERFRNSDAYERYVRTRELPPDAAGNISDESQASGAGWGAAARERFLRQLTILLGRYWKLLRRDRMNFLVLLFQGFLVAGLLWAVAGPDTFQPKGAENAQTVLFIMACAAAWLGILNGTKEIVKEQEIYARERRYGLRAGSYVLSKFLVLAGIGALQIGSLLILLKLWITFPQGGALAGFSPVWFEWFIGLEVTLMAGLALGLFVSASSKSVDAATAIMFVLLLVQVMFAGLFFPDSSWADAISVVAFSRWGLEAIGASADLNGILQSAVGSVYQPDPAYTFSTGHVLSRWLVLVTFTLALLGAAWRRQAKK